MKAKHTFVLTGMLGLAWTGYMFGNAAGPPPAVNGVLGPTCNQAGCHNSSPVNTGGTLVAIDGLPAAWTPGQSYALTVRITRAAARYGFQFSAVENLSNIQAGSLSAANPTDSRVSIVTAGGRQYAQHNALANVTGVFNFTWTAPPASAGGPVRFNVAGNAANGDFTNSGDFIYTASAVVAPASGDSTPPVITGVTATGVTPTSATISWTTDEDSDTQVQYGLTTIYSVSTPVDSTLTKTHTVTLSGLSHATTYHFRVRSRDASGNVAVSVDATFVTGYAIPNLGGVSRITDGGGDVAVGYARVRPNAGSTTPSGLAIFGLRQAGVLVTEAGVPDSPLITSGRIYAEIGADSLVNTGVAIANPNAEDTAVTFEIRNVSGLVVRSGGFTLTGTATPCTPVSGVICNQTAKFLNEAPFSAAAGLQGTLSFTSTRPVSVVALRGLLNERTPREFLITTLPVVDLSAPVATGTVVVPYFAAGEGWTTQLLLVNPSGSGQTGTLQVLDANGLSRTIRLDGELGNGGAYSVAANSSARFVITSATGPLTTGLIRVVPTGGGAAPTPLVIFSFKPGDFTVTEAGVPAVTGPAMRMYAEQSGTVLRTGLAVTNASPVPGTVTLSLTGLDGLPLAASTIPVNLPANGQFVDFIDNLLPSIAGQEIKGVLRITSTVPGISVVGLRARTNERGDFLITTTPPTVESGATAAAERLFPHLVNGGGYTTQFVLFSGTSGQTPAGSLSFTQQSGAPLELNVQ